mgnify:FL=1
MAIKIGNYNFEGPFDSTNSLRKQSGVYVILGRNTDAETWKVVDIGEAGDVQERVTNHDRSDCWKRQCYQRPLQVAVLYCNERDRMRIEQELRAQFNPPCGKQ